MKVSKTDSINEVSVEIRWLFQKDIGMIDQFARKYEELGNSDDWSELGILASEIAEHFMTIQQIVEDMGQGELSEEDKE